MINIWVQLKSFSACQKTEMAFFILSKPKNPAQIKHRSQNQNILLYFKEYHITKHHLIAKKGLFALYPFAAGSFEHRGSICAS